MNGVHDMGGMHGFGPIDHEVNEPVFPCSVGREEYSALGGPY